MIEEQVREAMIAELERQAEAKPDKLSIEEWDEKLVAHGSIDVDELVMAIVGSLAGGP